MDSPPGAGLTRGTLKLQTFISAEWRRCLYGHEMAAVTPDRARMRHRWRDRERGLARSGWAESAEGRPAVAELRQGANTSSSPNPANSRSASLPASTGQSVRHGGWPAGASLLTAAVLRYGRGL
jgi:hypothetical protein